MAKNNQSGSARRRRRKAKQLARAYRAQASLDYERTSPSRPQGAIHRALVECMREKVQLRDNHRHLNPVFGFRRYYRVEAMEWFDDSKHHGCLVRKHTGRTSSVVRGKVRAPSVSWTFIDRPTKEKPLKRLSPEEWAELSVSMRESSERNTEARKRDKARGARYIASVSNRD